MNPSRFDQWLNDRQRRPLVMGVLNVTPDSFSDGARFPDVSAAIAHGEHMATCGASLIDVGGESTRPGSEPVPEQEQIRRVVPVIRGLRERAGILVSIDTSRTAVAEAALEAGAHLVNDVFAGRDDPLLLPLVARRQVPIILMHMQGRPATMQVDPVYRDVTAEVIEFLEQRIAAAEAAGIRRERLLVDPGIGFGKTVEHNLQLLNGIGRFKSLNLPLAVGTSRKGFIEKITGERVESGRVFGTAATVAWAVANGADLVRVHDVGPMAQVVRMIEAIQRRTPVDFQGLT